MIHYPEENIIVRYGDLELTAKADVLMRTYLQSVGQTSAQAKPTLLAAPRIATAWHDQGGIYAGIMRGEKGLPDYHLIAPAGDRGCIKKVKFAESCIDVAGAHSEYDGLANTIALRNSAVSHPAAQWCAESVIDGHKDFYLPARRELSLLYATVPFLFENDWHWSSTQHAAYPGYAWMQTFASGHQDGYRKSIEYRVRLVRRILIIQ